MRSEAKGWSKVAASIKPVTPWWYTIIKNVLIGFYKAPESLFQNDLQTRT